MYGVYYLQEGMLNDKVLLMASPCKASSSYDCRINAPIGLPKHFGHIGLWLPLSGDNKPFLWVPHFPAPKAKWVETELWPVVVGGENFLRLPFC